MAGSSSIEWTDASWTPIRARYWEIQNDGSGKERIGWHCEHASEGCRFCYAEGMNNRLGTGMEFKPGNLYRPEHEGYQNGAVKLFLDEEMLLAPLRWKKPRKVFVCSMTDLFADFVPDGWIDRIFHTMGACDDLGARHTFQILTKRADRMRAYMASVRGYKAWNAPRLATEAWPPRNVWLGISAERQQEADERIPHLLNTPAAVRFISAEPLLGPISFRWSKWDDWKAPEVDHLDGLRMLDWIIVGGESGPRARPMHPQWARDIRDQCDAAGVAFFFKQWGEWAPSVTVDDAMTYVRVGKKSAGRLLDGKEHNAFPNPRPSSLDETTFVLSERERVAAQTKGAM